MCQWGVGREMQSKMKFFKEDILYRIMKNKLKRIMKDAAKQGKMYCIFHVPYDKDFIHVFTTRLKPEIEKEYTVAYLRETTTEELHIYSLYKILWCVPKKEF